MSCFQFSINVIGVSDLIVLQKNSNKTSLSPEEQAFTKTCTLSNGQKTNSLFENLHRVVHTKSYSDTDLYGNPAMVFEHEGGVSAMAADLRKMLAVDIESGCT